MNFDKINFVLDVLSSETILASQQNLLKLFVEDSIGNTEINQVEFKILKKDGRNTPTEIVAWTALTLSGAFYQTTFTPNLTEDSELELGVRITDTDSNIYFLSSNLKGVIR